MHINSLAAALHNYLSIIKWNKSVIELSTHFRTTIKPEWSACVFYSANKLICKCVDAWLFYYPSLPLMNWAKGLKIFKGNLSNAIQIHLATRRANISKWRHPTDQQNDISQEPNFCGFCSYERANIVKVTIKLQFPVLLLLFLLFVFYFQTLPKQKHS